MTGPGVADDAARSSWTSVHCSSEKAFYTDAWKAQLALLLISMTTLPGVVRPIRFYLCGECRLYHLTKKDGYVRDGRLA